MYVSHIQSIDQSMEIFLSAEDYSMITAEKLEEEKTRTKIKDTDKRIFLKFNINIQSHYIAAEPR